MSGTICYLCLRPLTMLCGSDPPARTRRFRWEIVSNHRGVLLRLSGCMTVRVEGERRGPMPQPISYRAIVHARSNQLRGMEVPEVVKTELRETQPGVPRKVVCPGLTTKGTSSRCTSEWWS